MEPLSVSIVAALAGAATASLNDVASDAIKDSYAALKRLISDRYKKSAAVTALEEDPASEAQKSATAEALGKTEATEDEEVLALTRQILAELKRLPQNTVTALGIDIEGLRAAEVQISDVMASGTAVRIRDTQVTGRFDVSGIRGGTGKN